MKGCAMELKVSDWQMNAWTSWACDTVYIHVCVMWPAYRKPDFHKTSFSGRAFHRTASTTQNSVPNIVIAADDSLASFNSRLKTRMFNQTLGLLVSKPVRQV